MFQEYKYIRHVYNGNINKHIYTYEIIDSNFIHQAITETVAPVPVIASDSAAFLVIKTYESKKLDVIPNLFLCNLYFCKKYDWKMDTVLMYQKLYINKYYGVNFNKYYNDLVKYTNKMMVLL